MLTLTVSWSTSSSSSASACSSLGTTDEPSDAVKLLLELVDDAARAGSIVSSGSLPVSRISSRTPLVVAPQVLEELGLEPADVLDRHRSSWPVVPSHIETTSSSTGNGEYWPA